MPILMQAIAAGLIAAALVIAFIAAILTINYYHWLRNPPAWAKEPCNPTVTHPDGKVFVRVNDHWMPL